MSEPATPGGGTDDIAGRTKRGLMWRFSARGVAGLVELGVGVLLARLLMPRDFGIMALAYLVTGFIAMFQSVGLPQAVIQREVLHEDHESTAFWATALMGCSLAGLMLALAQPAADFFNEEAVRGVIFLLSIAIVAGSLGAIPAALLERRLDFKRLFWRDLCGAVVYGGVAIPLALSGFSYWSLAWGEVARSSVQLVAVLALTRFVPRLRLNMRRLLELFSFGGPKVLAQVSGWSMQMIDYLIIGRFLSSAVLGLYKKAYQWGTEIIVLNILHPASSVLFPALSTLQNEKDRVRKWYLQSIRGLAGLLFPFIAFVGATAPQLIPVVFGEQWRDAVLPTQILCGVGILQVVLQLSYSAVEARGYVLGEAVANLVGALLLAAGLLIFVDRGVVVCAWVVLVANLALLIFIVTITALATGLRASELGRALCLPVLVAVIVGGLGYTAIAVGEALGLTPALQLLVASILAMAAFIGFSLLGPATPLRRLVRNMRYDLGR